MKDRWQNEFDECFGAWLNNNQGWLDRTQAGSIMNFIASLIHQARAEEKKKADELADALLMMYEQYCQDGHQFMSAGEAASTQLEINGYASFDGAGRLLTPHPTEGEV